MRKTVSGSDFFRCATSARRASTMRSSTVPELPPGDGLNEDNPTLLRLRTAATKNRCGLYLQPAIKKEIVMLSCGWHEVNFTCGKAERPAGRSRGQKHRPKRSRIATGGAQRYRHRLPQVPAPGALPRRGCAHQAPRLPRLLLLGTPRAGLRRSARRTADHRPRARRSRRQSHRPHVHRRPLRRFSLRAALSRGLRQPAGGQERRRRSGAAQRLHHRRRSLRAARQQAATDGDRQLLRISRRRTRPAAARAPSWR